jgi:hypothetical protein
MRYTRQSTDDNIKARNRNSSLLNVCRYPSKGFGDEIWLIGEQYTVLSVSQHSLNGFSCNFIHNEVFLMRWVCLSSVNNEAG